MKIVHVLEGYQAVAGGREVHVTRFVAGCDARGEQSLVLDAHDAATDPRSAIQKRFGDAPVDVILLHGQEGWRRAAEFAALAPAFAWVHDQGMVCPASISWFRRTRSECTLPPGMHCVVNAYTKRCNARRPDRNIRRVADALGNVRRQRSFAGVIVASEYMRHRLERAGVDAASISVLPYFVTPPAVAGPSEGAGRVLFVGRLAETKGIDVLLDAVGRSVETKQLLVVGDGYERSALEERARLVARNVDVQFLGYVTDDEAMANLYRAADVVAVPSVWPEPFGIVGLEAFGHERPVVASAVGGIPEWLRDGQDGHLVPPDDPGALAQKIDEALASPESRRRLGASGRRRVIDEFGWSRHWNTFEKIVSSRGARPRRNES